VTKKRVKAATRHARAKKVGIAALGGYDYHLERQGGGCAICGRPPKVGGRRLNVDHDHLTGAVRGLLCANHNRGLAWFSDSPDFLRIAATYLQYGWRAAIDHRNTLLTMGVE
jgi:hypothetical protein